MLYRCGYRSITPREGCRRLEARDPTPALGFAAELINEVLERDFGIRLSGAIVIDPLGSAGDAVYYGGRKFGVLHYDPPRFSLTPRGARVISLKRREPKGYVMVSRSAEPRIRRGYNVMRGGVKEASPGLSRVVVVNEDREPIAVGRWRGDRVAVMTRGLVGVFERPVETTRKEAIRGNSEAIASKAETAERRIREGVSGRAFVLYSGGKDSEVALRLAGVVDAKPIYIDTGLEFPEAREHALRTVEEFGGIVLEADTEAFRKAMGILGFPGVDFRRCTQILKIAPMRGILRPDDSLIVGLRAAESSSRRREQIVGRNRSLGVRQINPILDRTSLDVFLYARREGIELNPLYYRGLRRLGCRLCPASKGYDLLFLRRYYPALYRRLRELVAEYAENLRPDGRRYYFKSGRRPKTEPRFERLPPRCGNPEECFPRAAMLNACVGCKACERVCPKGAIRVAERVEIDRTACERCGACLEACPMVRAYRKLRKNLKR